MTESTEKKTVATRQGERLSDEVLTLEGVGRTGLDPANLDVAEIGGDSPVARALPNLANQCSPGWCLT
jgi:hypothetical protein